MESREFFEELFLNEEKPKKEIINHPLLVRMEFAIEQREEAFMDVLKYLWVQVNKGNDKFIRKLITSESRKRYILKCVVNRLKQLKKKKFSHYKCEKSIDPEKFESISQSNEKRTLEIHVGLEKSLVKKIFDSITSIMQSSTPAQKEIWKQSVHILELALESPELYLQEDKNGCHFNVKKLSDFFKISRPAIDIRIEKIKDMAKEIQKGEKND